MRLFQFSRIKLRVQQGVQRLWFDHHQRFIFRNQAFRYHITGNLQRRSRGTLAVSGLKHEQLAVFNREFHVLHIAVMLFQLAADLHEAIVCIRHDFF